MSHNITHLLKEWSDGDEQALDRLTPLVYEELRQQAARYLRRERPGHTLQTTALINEAYLRLIDVKDVRWQNRAHFFAIAANLMRRVLVDHARRRDAEKRGGANIRMTLNDALAVSKESDIDLLAIDEALDKLALIDPQQARVVELRFFSGLNVEETATARSLTKNCKARLECGASLAAPGNRRITKVTSAQWEELKALFEAASGVGATERTALLANAGDDESKARSRVAPCGS